jgi:translation initiation factor IF-2
MAKKRVHELAKQYNMPTAEVMKRLNAAGMAVKATASAVDEVEADAALTGKKKPSPNGAKPKQPPRPQLRPPGDLGIRDLGARPPEGAKP